MMPRLTSGAIGIPGQRSWYRLVTTDATVRREQRCGGGAPAQVGYGGTIRVRNDTAADVGFHAILGISGPIIDPKTSVTGFRSKLAMRGVVPQTAHAGRFVVTREPIRAGAIGRAYAVGLTILRCKMGPTGDSVDQFADVDAGVTDRLTAGSSGSARLLWVEPKADRTDPLVAWCYASIGIGGGTSVKFARIEGYTADNQRFVVRELVGGVPSGNQFELHLNLEGTTLDLRSAIVGVGPGRDLAYTMRTIVGETNPQAWITGVGMHGTCQPGASPGASLEQFVEMLGVLWEETMREPAASALARFGLTASAPPLPVGENIEGDCCG